MKIRAGKNEFEFFEEPGLGCVDIMEGYLSSKAEHFWTSNLLIAEDEERRLKQLVAIQTVAGQIEIEDIPYSVWTMLFASQTDPPMTAVDYNRMESEKGNELKKKLYLALDVVSHYSLHLDRYAKRVLNLSSHLETEVQSRMSEDGTSSKKPTIPNV